MWVVLLLLHLLFDNFHSKESLIIIILHWRRFDIQVGAISSCGCEERQHLSVLKVMSKKGAHRTTTKHEMRLVSTSPTVQKIK
jgi:hypothetical protein